MEPTTVIVTALVLGVAAGLKPTAEQAVKDAYTGIKAVILRKYPQINLSSLEKDPSSQSQQLATKDELEKANAAKDQELLTHTQVLLNAIKNHHPTVAATVGVELESIKGISLNIDGVKVDGSGVVVRKSNFAGDINISNIRAG